MSTAALQTLRDAIKYRSFDPAYCVFGEDDFQKEDAVKQLQLAALDPGTRDFNLELRRGSELDAENLSTILSTPPMMADRRVVVVRDATGLKKDARKILDVYLKKPAPDLLLVLTVPQGVKPDKTLLDSATPLQFDELTGDRLPKWINYTASAAHGVTISESAIELLQSSIGSDLYQLSTELDKLASYTQGAPIDEAAVADIVGVIPGETVTDFLDALAECDLGKALPLIPRILSQPKMSGVSLVMALSTQMLAIAWGRERLNEGTSRNRIAQDYFSLLKDTGVFAARSWGSASAAWSKAAVLWSVEDLARALDALLDADVALKESRVSSEEQIISSIVLVMCSRNGIPAAA